MDQELELQQKVYWNCCEYSFLPGGQNLVGAQGDQ